MGIEDVEFDNEVGSVEEMSDLDTRREELKQIGWPNDIAAKVYLAKKQATNMFHNDHNDGDTAIYMLLEDLGELVNRSHLALLERLENKIKLHWETNTIGDGLMAAIEQAKKEYS